MAAETPGHHSEQSLQQFVNQSTWDHEPIRRRLMQRIVGALRPTAWVIEEVAFPKHGRLSAAVERQYVRSLQKLCNCQLSVTVTLTTHRFSVPVNWRLIVPEAWGQDLERRARARMPQHELPRPYWRYQIELLDDMALDWGMSPAPIVADTRQMPTAERLLTALEDRVQPYLVQVSDSLRVRYQSPTPRRASGSADVRTSSWLGGAGDLVHGAAALARTTVGWQGVNDDLALRSQFLQVPVHSPDTDGARGRAVGKAQRRLLVEWPLSKPHPRGYWITNIPDGPLEELVALAKLRQRVTPRIEEIAGRYGLRDYEGRTFVGWHRHVTLAAAAHIFDLLNLLQSEEQLAERMVPVGVR